MGVKYTGKFKKPLPSVLTIPGIVASVYLLAVAAAPPLGRRARRR